MKESRKKILLASISFSAYDWLPYPVGVLISHCRKDTYINDYFEFLVPEYRGNALEIDEFHDKMKQADFLGLTNWVWNQNYNDQIARLYKKYRPDGVVIYGGANVPEDQPFNSEYAAKRPFVDIFFCGPSEETFKNFLLNYHEVGCKEVPGTFTRESDLVIKDKSLYKNINIPSPYLDGVFESILKSADTPITAIFETNRGCPYRCTFCDWGGMIRTGIVQADKDQVRDTISYIMSFDRIHEIKIADANFGILPDDLRFMEHLVECQKKRKKKIRLRFGGFAKNGGKTQEKIMRLMAEHFNSCHDGTSLKFSFQSHDPVVLETSYRKNIKNEKLYPMVERLQKDGYGIDAEMIIGLPGDNEERWLASIQKNMDLKIQQQRSFTLHIVPNTTMAFPEYQEKYKMKTKKVKVPNDLYLKNTGFYHKTRKQHKVFTESRFEDPSEYQEFELLYECFSFDSVELMKIYDVWFWFNTLYNSKIARQWMLESPDSAREQYQSFMANIENGKMPFFRDLLEEFRYGVWHTLAKPEPETRLEELYLVKFAFKFIFRGNEVVEIYENQERALQELKTVYPQISFNHFNPKYQKDPRTLYFLNADVTA